MLGYRHQFEMRETEFDGVGHEAVGEFVPVEPALVLAADAPPRADMHFVDGHRLVVSERATGRSGRRQRRAHHRCRGRSQLRLACVGIGAPGFVGAVHVDERELVACTGRDAWNEDLPHAGLAAQTHGMATRVPGIPVADHRHAPRVGRPHREQRAVHAADAARMRTELVVGALFGAFGQQPQVGFAEHGQVTVGIVLRRAALAVGPFDAQAVIGAFTQARQAIGEQSARVARLERGNDARAIGGDRVDLHRARQEDRQPPASIGIGMRTEQGEGIAVFTARERIPGLVRHRRSGVVRIVHGGVSRRRG